jgi:hypothetical protein
MNADLATRCLHIGLALPRLAVLAQDHDAVAMASLSSLLDVPLAQEAPAPVPASSSDANAS